MEYDLEFHGYSTLLRYAVKARRFTDLGNKEQGNAGKIHSQRMGIQTVGRNVNRILASIKMLEINISAITDIL